VEVERDYEMRLVAIDRVRSLSDRYNEIVPLQVLREGFVFAGERISFGSFYSGIFRPRQMRGPAALSLTTTPLKVTGDAPYDDGLDDMNAVWRDRDRSSPHASARHLRLARFPRSVNGTRQHARANAVNPMSR
jgi:hypothetical protein